MIQIFLLVLTSARLLMRASSVGSDDAMSSPKNKKQYTDGLRIATKTNVKQTGQKRRTERGIMAITSMFDNLSFSEISCLLPLATVVRYVVAGADQII